MVVPMPIFFCDLLSSLPTTHRLALAVEHGADAEVAHLHRPARGDEGEKRRSGLQSDRSRTPETVIMVTVNSALPKASALDPQPVLGGVGVVSGRLYGLLVIA